MPALRRAAEPRIKFLARNRSIGANQRRPLRATARRDGSTDLVLISADRAPLADTDGHLRSSPGRAKFCSATPKQTCPWPRPRAQLAFKDLMIHGILQFTLSIAFRYILHRGESRDIRCRES
jgi:hypothetical protein